MLGQERVVARALVQIHLWTFGLLGRLGKRFPGLSRINVGKAFWSPDGAFDYGRAMPWSIGLRGDPLRDASGGEVPRAEHLSQAGPVLLKSGERAGGAYGPTPAGTQPTWPMALHSSLPMPHHHRDCRDRPHRGRQTDYCYLSVLNTSVSPRARNALETFKKRSKTRFKNVLDTYRAPK